MRALRVALVVTALGTGALGAAGPATAAEQCTTGKTCIELTASPNPVGTSSETETKYLSISGNVTSRGPSVGQATVTADVGAVTGAGMFHSVGATRGTCSYSASTETATCALGQLGSGQTATINVVFESPESPGTITVPGGAWRLSVNERVADNPPQDPRVDTAAADGTSTEATDSNELTWVPAFTPVTIWAGNPFAVAPSCVNKTSSNDAGSCEPAGTIAGAGGLSTTTGTRSATTYPELGAGPDLNNLQNGSSSIPSNTGQYQARFLECGASDSNTTTTCADVVTVCPYTPADPGFVNCLRQGSTWDAKIAYPGPQVTCATGSVYRCSGPLRFDLSWDPSLIPPGQTGDTNCRQLSSGSWSCTTGNFALFHFDEPATGQVAQLTSSDVVSRRCTSPNPTSISADCIWNPHIDAQTGYFTVTLFSNENGRMR